MCSSQIQGHCQELTFMSYLSASAVQELDYLHFLIFDQNDSVVAKNIHS